MYCMLVIMIPHCIEVRSSTTTNVADTNVSATTSLGTYIYSTYVQMYVGDLYVYIFMSIIQYVYVSTTMKYSHVSLL